MSIDEIKNRLRSGDVTGAEAAAQELLATEPDNVQAKMLYGICRQLQGDETTFRQIHDELAPKMTMEGNEKTLSLWRRYHKLWMALIVVCLVLAGVAGGVLYFAEDVEALFGEMNVATINEASVKDRTVIPTSLYAGPPNKGLRFSDEPDPNKCR